jgi:hypothetical protein
MHMHLHLYPFDASVFYLFFHNTQKTSVLISLRLEEFIYTREIEMQSKLPRN